MLLLGLVASLPWISDDWAAAKKKAVAENKLVAVDVWATWCHSCLSMQNFVLDEPEVTKIAAERSWLKIDFDRPENAAFLDKFPVGALPTFLVVDPKLEKVVGRWVGTGTPAQMARFFKSASWDAKDPASLGQRALAEEDYAKAISILAPALAAEKDADLKTELANGYLEALSNTDKKLCAEKGSELATQLEGSSPGIDALANALYCAEELEDAGRALAKPIVDRLALEAKKNDPRLSADDRSGLLDLLASGWSFLGEDKRAEEVTQARLEVLSAARSKAKTPAAKATFDAHLVDVLVRLGKHGQAESVVRESERAFPDDFNHPARLALVYLEAGRVAEGLDAVSRALAKAYGPRRLRIHVLRVQLFVKGGRWDEARGAIKAARDEIARLDKGLVSPHWLGRLEELEKEIVEAQPKK